MWTDDQMVTAFNTLAGGVASLATSTQKIQWFNEGQARLGYYAPTVLDVEWERGDREIDLPDDFISLDKLVVDSDSSLEPWRVFGRRLILDDPSGATGDGSARLYYWSEFTQMTSATTQTELTRAQDYACLYYALSQFYRALVSSRAYYKRYATLVGANAVSMRDLQAEADRYYQDYLDSREDAHPLPAALTFGGT